MGFLDSLFGSDDSIQQVPTLTPAQQKLLKSMIKNGIENNPLYGAGNDYLMNLLSNEPGAHAAFEAPYMQQFNQQIVPAIAERFAGAGTGGGAMSSSALNNSLAQAGSGLQAQLAALRSQRQLQGVNSALAYAQQPYANKLGLLGVNSFENVYQPGSGGLFGTLLPAIGTAAGAAFGGPFGAAAGGALSSLFSNAFKGGGGVGTGHSVGGGIMY